MPKNKNTFTKASARAAAQKSAESRARKAAERAALDAELDANAGMCAIITKAASSYVATPEGYRVLQKLIASGFERAAEKGDAAFISALARIAEKTTPQDMEPQKLIIEHVSPEGYKIDPATGKRV